MRESGREELAVEIGNIRDELKSLRTELKTFYIDRETHYKDHQFLGDLREWVDSIKSTTIRTVVTAVVLAMIGLLVGGFLLWGKKKMGS